MLRKRPTYKTLIQLTRESFNDSKLDSVSGISVFTAGANCSTDADLLNSSAVSSLRREQNRSALRDMTTEATRRVIARRADSIVSVLSDEPVRGFDVLQKRMAG